MTYPLSPGQPTYSDGFIPELWSAQMLAKYYADTLVNKVTAVGFDGMIRAVGDKVNIRQVPTITVRDYVAGQALVSERPEAEKVQLLIDKGKYFSVELDDVMKVQSDLDLLSAFTADATRQIRIQVDEDVLNAIPANAHAANRGETAGTQTAGIDLGATGSPVTLTKANVVDKLIDLAAVLDEQAVPNQDRYVILPTWAAALIKKSDLKDASLAGDTRSMVRTGELGMIDRFRVFQSTLLDSVTDGADTCWNIVAGHRQSVVFATQFTNIERLRAEATFADILRGMQVYGYKVVKPEGLAVLYARAGAEST